MRPHSDATRVALRRAVLASVAIHVVVAGAFVALPRASNPAPLEPTINTRAPEVRMSFVEDVPDVEVAPQSVPVPPSPTTNSSLETEAPKTNTPPQPLPPTVVDPTPSLHAGPFTPQPPRTLPAELAALLRKPNMNPSPGPITDPNVRPVAGTTGAKTIPASAPALHGALKPAQTVVYVIDSSGSMGAGGKFDVARAALIATLTQQPATVRFQVIVYDSTARPLLASNGTALAATDVNVRAATAKLATLEPRGRSNHLVAVRAALGFRPEVIVLLTDADDLTAAALKLVQGDSVKPVPVYVGLVTAGGVQQPRELK